MFKPITVYILLLLPLLVMAAEKKQVSIHGYDWNGEVPPGAEVVVSNAFGNISARNHGENRIFLHATYQKIGSEPLEPEFKIEQRQGKWFIEVVYPAIRKNGEIYDKKGKLRGRTDLAILFPEPVKMRAITTFGKIKLDKSSSSIWAESRSGDIQLATTGLFNVHSAAGEINLKLRGFSQPGNSTATTGSGNINAEIFSDMKMLLTARTKGDIRQNGKVVKGNIHTYSHGKASSTVALTSKSGTVDINIVSPPDLVKSIVPSTADSGRKK